jgi:hypothetical protein
VTEQRRHHRIPVGFKVQCIPEDGNSFEGTVTDLGVGGMFVESERVPTFGTTLTLVLVGLATRELKLPATVRWSEPQGFGVQFGLLGAYATHVIVDLVKKTSS